MIKNVGIMSSTVEYGEVVGVQVCLPRTDNTETYLRYICIFFVNKLISGRMVNRERFIMVHQNIPICINYFINVMSSGYSHIIRLMIVWLLITSDITDCMTNNESTHKGQLVSRLVIGKLISPTWKVLNKWNKLRLFWYIKIPVFF